MAKIRANIYDKAYVPSLGRGPFTNKVIHEELFRSLKRLGYVVENADEAVSDSLIFGPPVSVGDDGVQTPTPETPKEDEEETAKEEEVTESPKVEENEAGKEEETEAGKEEETESTEEEAVAETQADVEAKKAVENKVELTDEEVKFLTGNARRQEIIDLLTEKGVHIENENATIAELLNLVGLTRK